MSHQKLNFLSNIYFWLILLSGFLYSVFLVVASKKIIPALLMQVIFLLDALKFNDNIVGLITSRLFLLNVIPGLILIGLISQFGKTLIKSAKSIHLTDLFINGLEIIKITQKFTQFRSDNSLIFTSGFFKPKIFASSTLFKTHNREEIKAMLQHEIHHQKNLHPLKIFLANFIKLILPALPGKNWLLDNYLTLVEVSSDQFSEDKTKNKLPLVSALLKFQSRGFEPMVAGISCFNSQSERIKILIGQKKQWLKIPMAYYSLVLVVILSGTLFMKNSNLFFDCQHLLKCIEILVTPNSQSLITSVNSSKNTFFLSDHCQ